MEFLSDLVLGAAAIGAAVYCFVLSRRLRALGTLEGGLGSAIALLSSQVDDLQRMLASAREAAGHADQQLDTQTRRAEAVSRRLELLVASMHDLPSAEADDRPPSRWPADAARHPGAARPPDSADTGPTIDPPTRARILRRRQVGEDRP